MHFGVDPNLIEEIQITQGLKYFSGQDRLEINNLLGVIVEPYFQGVRRNNLK